MSRILAFRSSLAAIREERRPAAPALIHAGRFDRSAIMRAAVKLARTILPSFGPWSRRMAVALRTIWSRAKAAISAAAAEPFPIRAPEPVRSARSPIRPAFRSRALISGARVFAHGW